MDSCENKQLSQEIEELKQSLPKEESWFSDGLVFYQGFWCPSWVFSNVISVQKHFQAHNDDIILASKPKSGTTWLKALIFSIVNRNHFTCSNSPVLTSNPHELIPFLEFDLYKKQENPDLTKIPFPRLFSTHMPYTPLPESVKESNCRIVYISRNPYDNIVSSWHFAAKVQPEKCVERPIEEYIESTFRGVDSFGPFWEHVLGYWKESMKKPDKVLFLKYEDLMNDTIFQLKRLAEFIGFPFSAEEEKGRVIEDIRKMCSLNSLKDLGVNKNGEYIPNYKNKNYFRKGEVGDWVNYLTPSMVEHLEQLMHEKLSGSGLTFDSKPKN